MESRRKRLSVPHPLRLWREQQGLNQQAFAARCDISQSMVSLIETGLRVPLDDTLVRLMEYTGLPAEAFVLPERFLQEQPDFLQKYGPRGKGKRRPRP